MNPTHASMITIASVLVLVAICLPNVHATCVTGPGETTICAGISQTVNITKSSPASNMTYGKNPDVIITPNCALNDLRYWDYMNSCYQPNTLYVKLGTRVVWKNDDTSPHSVTFGNSLTAVSQGYFFDSKTIEPGGSFSYKFNLPGAYPYFDSFNWFETGLVIVKRQT